MFDFFKKLFVRKNDDSCDDFIEALDGFEYTNAPDIEFPKDYDESKRNLFIIDDSDRMISVFTKDMEIIKSKQESELYAQYVLVQEEKIKKLDLEFNVFVITTQTAVFSLKKFLEKNPNFVIDFAIVDIQFEGIMFINGKSTVLDGIDAYIMLKTQNPDTRVYLTSSYHFQEQNKDLELYKQKYRSYEGTQLEHNIHFKDDNHFKRRGEIVKFLFL
jgi:hypothetical protein